MATKNLGQVSGVHIGSTPPSNTILIWYDSTPSQLRHKVYDPTLKQWVVLDQNIISAITYSELTNMAKNSGLSVGEYFQITDRSNTLALAITSTKVQYCDALGNILVDDLGTNIQYHVTSSNLQIDDVVGVFDETNRKLVFQFKEQTPDFTADDYVLGKVKRNNIWSLAKYKLSSFLSKVTGNSITWNGGFFFSFSDALKNVIDKAGGVVSKTTYDRDKEQLTTSINNVGKENQNIIQNAHNELTEATKPDSFYGTKLPSISTGGEATDIAKGDTLLSIVSKIQRYINKFKYATGIRMPNDYSSINTVGQPNNNDTVNTAIRKLHRMFSEIKLSLPEDFKPYENEHSDLEAGDDFTVAFAKIEADRRRANLVETPKQQCTIDNVFSEEGTETITVNFRVNNGKLEIYLQETQMYVQWIYTRTIVNDTERFITINLPDELAQNLSTFLENPQLSTDITTLTDISVIAAARVSNAGLSWEVPTKLLLARLSFGYSTNYHNGKVTFGFILTPMILYSSSLIEGEGTTQLQTQAEANEGTTTFQGWSEGGGFRFYFPKMLVQYNFL